MEKALIALYSKLLLISIHLFIICISFSVFLSMIPKIKTLNKPKVKRKEKNKRKLLNSIRKMSSINLTLIDEDTLYNKVIEKGCLNNNQEIQNLIIDSVVTSMSNIYNLYIYRLRRVGVLSYERQDFNTTNLIITHLSNNSLKDNLNILNELTEILIHTNLYINSLNKDDLKYKLILIDTIECIDSFNKFILKNTPTKAELFITNMKNNIEILNNL